MQGSDFKRSAGLSSRSKADGNSVFNEVIHKPPTLDNRGYNVEKHNGRELLNTFSKNILSKDNKIPPWW
jgi:hypothetical protein